MTFNLAEAIPVLERTPAVVSAWLKGLPDEWLHTNEGPDTFSPFDVAGHLVHGEKTDWVVRIQTIL